MLVIIQVVCYHITDPRQTTVTDLSKAVLLLMAARLGHISFVTSVAQFNHPAIMIIKDIECRNSMDSCILTKFHISHQST